MSGADAASLWIRFHGELYAFLRSRVDSDDVAQDILQNAFLRAHQRLGSGDAPAHPRAWLYQIVKNLIVDARRHAKRRRDLAAAITDDPMIEGSDERDAFAVVARRLPMFIDELDPIYREALTMTELEGLTQAEAARRAGISLSGMKSRVQRGRQLVLESLRRCCEVEVDVRRHVIGCTSRADRRECC